MKKTYDLPAGTRIYALDRVEFEGVRFWQVTTKGQIEGCDKDGKVLTTPLPVESVFHALELGIAVAVVP